MLQRRSLLTLSERLHEAPAVVVLGPRQVGKTTLALTLADSWPAGAIYLDLERPADRLRLDDADGFLRAQGSKLVILDEIHRMPGLFEVLRGSIDERHRAGQRFGHFLLLGSASLDLMQQSSETLAGRVSYLDMGPIHALEWPGNALDTLWLRGGFPDSLLGDSDAASFRWREDCVRSYLQRDVPLFAPRLPAQTVGRLWTMLAHQQGALLQQSRLASGLGVSSPAVERYIDLLVDLQLVRRLQPWSGNVGKRLVKAPKVYVRDSGLVHALLGLGNLHDVTGHPVCGPSYEGFCIDNLLAVAPAHCTAYTYRTHVGAEIDLLLERAGRPWMAIEIKRSLTPALSKGFDIACADLHIDQRYVVYPGVERFPMRYGTQAIGLVQLMDLLATGAQQ
ncbi:MAG: ATP-binding protein [Rhodoferax sp.]|nr:ATP-binding protein [Rhodoferax sp.]